ncbi:MAG: hypothetical protein P8Y70_00250 [Candidatus Lokiarchaeota archaeon]
MNPEETLKFYNKQLKCIQQQIPLSIFYSLKVICPDCGRKVGMINIYRCYQCGLFICGKCAEKHFGVKRKNNITITKGVINEKC